MDKYICLSLQQLNAILSPPLGNCNRLIAQQLYLILTSLPPPPLNCKHSTFHPHCDYTTKISFHIKQNKITQGAILAIPVGDSYNIYLFLTINRKLPRHHCYRL